MRIVLCCAGGLSTTMLMNAMKDTVQKSAKLNEADFDLVTTYDNCHYTKPSIGYFNEVLEKIGEDTSHCLMVGIDTFEDGVIETIGVPLYLVKDYLIHRDDTPLTSTYVGTSDEFLSFVKAMPQVK